MSSGTGSLRTGTGQRVITQKKIPVWAIIVIIVLVIIAIVAPIIVWWLMSRARKGGSGATCTVTTDCATGLTCSGGTCAVPICIKPSQPKYLKDTHVLNLPGWDVELEWQATSNTDYYLIFVGDTTGYNPIEEALFVGVSDTNSFVFEQVPALTDAFIRVVAVNSDCGTGEYSAEHEINTGAII